MEFCINTIRGVVNKMKNIDKMGVLVLMSHLVITLAFIIIYALAIFNGHDDETLRTILTVIVGYWFGAVGKEAIMNRPQRKHKDEGNIRKGV